MQSVSKEGYISSNYNGMDKKCFLCLYIVWLGDMCELSCIVQTYEHPCKYVYDSEKIMLMSSVYCIIVPVLRLKNLLLILLVSLVLMTLVWQQEHRMTRVLMKYPTV